MVTFAGENRKAELVEIWQRSFGDSEEYIRMFLEWNFQKCRIVIYELAGKAVSVAYLLPIVYTAPGKADKPCLYLYAAATLPEHRGHGYFGEILKFIRENIPEPVILVPGEQSLISYYEKQGLSLWLSERRLKIGCEALQGQTLQYDVSDLNFKVYKVIRDKLLADTGFMKWDIHFMEYICHENKVCGGTQKHIRVNGTDYVVLYRMEDRQLSILELLPHKEAENCVLALLKETGCKSAAACLQPVVMTTQNISKDNSGYFNLTMG